MNFDDLLSRTDEVILQSLLGRNATKLVALLDGERVSVTRMRDLVIELHSREGLLLDSEGRNHLLDLLHPSEAQHLLKILAGNETGDVYADLKATKFSRGSEREKALFEFFEMYAPELESNLRMESIESCPASYPLFEHQRRAALNVTRYLANEPRRVLLHMPTGAGKTRTAMNVLADHLRRRKAGLVVWLAYSEELCEQAVQEWQTAWHHLGNREVNVYRYWGNHKFDLEQARDGLMVAGLSKLYVTLQNNTGQFGVIGGRCSLVVIDEAHQAIAQTYSLVLDTLFTMNPESALLGLTATPGRTWSDIEADTALVEFFQGNKVGLEIPGYSNPVDYLIEEGYIARAQFYSLMHSSGINLSASDREDIEAELELPKEIIAQLADDLQRNLKIVAEVKRLAQTHRRILVFAATVQHSQLLAVALQAQGLHATSLDGTTSSGDRARLIADFKNTAQASKVLCNYGVLTTGFDAPQTSAVVIARPTKSLVLYSQMVGRAIRGVKAGGNEQAEIVTVVDSDLPGFGAVAEAFHNWEDVWETK